MIRKVFANNPSFKVVEFHSGFNVVLADRTKESTKKDSRNGLGKSTLIEIIHFCLGARALRGKGLLVDPLKDWAFSIVLQMEDEDITITRAVNNPDFVTVDRVVSCWPLQGEIQNGQSSYNVKEFNSWMGCSMFGLRNAENGDKYQPTFRSLISYFVRKGRDAFSTPFEHFRKQKEWDKQVHNAFLLGLDWEDAAGIQILKDRKKGLTEFKKAAKSGVIKGFTGSLGDLEAQKVRLKTHSDQENAELQSFKVHPQYTQMQVEANALTQEIHDFVNSGTINKRLMELYAKNLTEEHPPFEGLIDQVYREAGVALPGFTLRRIDDVQKFHKTIIENRRTFLSSEIDRICREISESDSIIRSKTERRASIMEVLRTHGAFEEYTLLQTRHMDTINSLNSISTIIENLKKLKTGLSDVKIAQEELQKKARRDYEERSEIREYAIEFFNYYSERLYNVPGKLIIDVGPKGFQFDVEIERSGSSGINNMKVFCYDLTLARLWANRKPSPKICVHDSLIFDGVDERQRALALETAAAESNKHLFQYICTLNSDYIPWDEFSDDFDLKKHIRLTLTDENPEGCLLGMRF